MREGAASKLFPPYREGPRVRIRLPPALQRRVCKLSVPEHHEENIAAASAATVQQAGIALGAAAAGLVANASGLDNGLDPGSALRASLWVPLALVAAPLAAGAVGVRLNLMVPRSPEQGLPAARSG